MGVKTVTVHKRLGGGPTNGNVVCRFWKEGRCNRNPCRFLHGEPAYPDAYLRIAKQSLVLTKDRPRKCPYYDPKNSSVSTANGCQSEAKTFKKISNYSCEDRARKNPSYILKTPFALITRPGTSEDQSTQKSFNLGTASEDKLPRKSSNHSTEDLPKKYSSESKDESAPETSGSATEVVVLKEMKPCLKCPEDGGNSSLISTPGDVVSEDKTAQKSQKRVCEQWMLGNCVEGDRCQFMHSWFHGDGFSMLARLSGHNLAVSGIALPSGCDKLYSGSSDGTVRVWDCHTGKAAGVLNLGDKIGSLISVGPWVFIGIPNVVKAWNIETATDFSLNGPVGQVYAMAVALDMLFAGAEDGVISVWKGSAENLNTFQLATSLKGHMSAVMCLAAGAEGLYSGSMDSTIRVWNLDTLQCTHTLNGHTDAVMSLIFWNEYLLSCSLDRTIKVWIANEVGNMEVTYTHEEEHGALALCGVVDAEAKPILLCSCDDNSVHLYELPSFSDRGRIFSKQEVITIQMGPGGLFFTGDGTGMLSVWKLAEANGLASQET